MDLTTPQHSYQTTLTAVSVLGIYILLVRYFRFQRRDKIQARFKQTGRPLSSMTVKEAHQIIREMRELEFPYTLHNAMKLSLLKVNTHPYLPRINLIPA